MAQQLCPSLGSEITQTIQRATLTLPTTNQVFFLEGNDYNEMSCI